MISTSKILFTAIILLAFVYKSQSIYCYYCNSANNSACIDLDLLDDELRSRLIPVVHCETAIPPNPVAMNFFCRKIVQTIFHSQKDSEVRVTRGCGWVRHHRECYRADNSDHLETVCQCFNDHCNDAQAVNPASTTAMFLTLSAVLYLFR